MRTGRRTAGRIASTKTPTRVHRSIVVNRRQKNGIGAQPNADPRQKVFAMELPPGRAEFAKQQQADSILHLTR